jgi:hypothetical protein
MDTIHLVCALVENKTADEGVSFSVGEVDFDRLMHDDDLRITTLAEGAGLAQTLFAALAKVMGPATGVTKIRCAVTLQLAAGDLYPVGSLPPTICADVLEAMSGDLREEVSLETAAPLYAVLLRDFTFTVSVGPATLEMCVIPDGVAEQTTQPARAVN